MSWTQFLNDTTVRFSVLQKETPEMFAGFGVMSKAAKKNGVLDEKTKELIALGIAISTRCETCIAFHVKSLERLHTSRNELCEALEMIGYMEVGRPSLLLLKRWRPLMNLAKLKLVCQIDV